MISLKDGSLQLRGSVSPIQSWAVWFMSPMGATPDRQAAVDQCVRADLDPEVCIIPVPVVIAENGEYEIFLPRR